MKIQSRALSKHEPQHEMDAINYNYSMKNIPIPTDDQYLFKLIQMTEQFIKRLRWKAFFFLQKDNESDKSNKETYKFKTRD